MSTIMISKSSKSSGKKNKIKQLLDKSNMVINCYKFVKKSWPTGDTPNRTALCEKTASILGVNIANIHHIIKDYKENGRPKSMIARPKFTSKINDYHKRAIVKKVHSFYARGELATFENILKAVNNDVDLPNFNKTSFQKVLKRLKYEYVKQYALIEKNDIAVWRLDYLRDIQRYRSQNRPIFYVLNETLVNTGHTVPRSKNTKKSARNSIKGKKLTVVHIGNENGFVDEAIDIFESHTSSEDQESDANRFEQWFENILPKLGENAVVVMDNAPNQSRLQEVLPSWGWDKANMKKWLQTKNISFNKDDTMVELYMKVKKEKARFKKYVVNELAIKHNVDVLRLPPYHYDLNPMDLIWADVKTRISQNIPLEHEELKTLIHEEIKNISSDKLRHYVEVIKEKMEYFNKLDHMIDNTIDTFLEDNSFESDPEDYEKLWSDSTDDTCSDTDENCSDTDETGSDSYETFSDTDN